jgi:predicted PurR-regulated permease PerM
MFENSKDVLNWAIAVSVVGFTAMAAWGMYYFARIMQQAFKVIREMRDRLHKIDEIIQSIKDKIEHSTSYLLLISEGIKKLVEVLKEKGVKLSGGDEKK